MYIKITLSTFFLVALSQLTFASNDNLNARNLTHAAVTKSNGDSGWFQPGEDNIVILKSDNSNAIVARYRSAKGNKYRLWIDSGKDFPVPLKSEDQFRNFLDHIDATAEKDWCEIPTQIWSPWTPVGGIPTTCGTQSYTETRTCTLGPSDKPCPDISCGTPETRDVTVDNGNCAPVLTAFNVVPAGKTVEDFGASVSCSDANSDALQYAFRAAGACSLTSTLQWTAANTGSYRRNSIGTCTVSGYCRDTALAYATQTKFGNVTSSCNANIWTPAAGSCAKPGELTQTNQCGDIRASVECTGAAPRVCLYHPSFQTGISSIGTSPTPFMHSWKWWGTGFLRADANLQALASGVYGSDGSAVAWCENNSTTVCRAGDYNLTRGAYKGTTTTGGARPVGGGNAGATGGYAFGMTFTNRQYELCYQYNK
jgi:hypothetical protein